MGHFSAGTEAGIEILWLSARCRKVRVQEVRAGRQERQEGIGLGGMGKWVVDPCLLYLGEARAAQEGASDRGPAKQQA
jgi:hypothetical protein